MEEAEAKFKEFDWASSQGWQQYWNNLYPTPPLSKVDKFKRSWFKRNVDSNISPVPLSDVKQTQQYTQNHYRYLVKPSVVAIEIYIRLIYLFITVPLFVLPMIPIEYAKYICIRLYYTSVLTLFIFLVLGVVRERGLPKFNSAWLSSAFFSDMTQYIMYLCFMTTAPPRTIFLILPFITCLIGLNNLVETGLPEMPKLAVMTLAKIYSFTKEKNYWLLQTRGDLECYIIFYIILKVFTKALPIISLFTYMNFIKMRLNSSNAFISLAFSNIHGIMSFYIGCIIRVLSNGMLGPVPLNMYLKLVQIFKRYILGQRT